MLKAQIIGNIGSDPELRYSASGTATLRFNVASNRRIRNQAGEWQDETTWVRVAIFGNRAEALAQHLARGTRVYVDGRLEARPWIDRTNAPRAGLEIIGETVEFVGGRRQESDDQAASVADERRTPVAVGARYAAGTDDRDLGDLPF